MKKFIIFCLLFLGLNITAYGGGLSKIELTDGSILNGEIVSYLNGIYTINTANFGVIKVSSTKVSKIESVNNVLPNTPINFVPQSNNPTQSQVSTYGQTLMKNPENAAIFKELTSNPGLQKMASDPQVQAVAKTGDIQSLMDNPEFMKIVNSPEIQESVKKLKQ